jgi:hypothetical protein
MENIIFDYFIKEKIIIDIFFKAKMPIKKLKLNTTDFIY